jgi:hypothetical protein
LWAYGLVLKVFLSVLADSTRARLVWLVTQGGASASETQHARRDIVTSARQRPDLHRGVQERLDALR